MEKESTNGLYKECQRNHAASLGSYATDGCCEFTLDDTSPGSLQCAACGCHRNFHLKVSGDRGGVIRCREAGGFRGRQSVSEWPESGERMNKKRFRTKFTAEQKEKMVAFAEKLGWKLQRKEQEDEIQRFCRGVGVSRQVFKVWMHNHKNSSSSSSSSNANVHSSTTQ